MTEHDRALRALSLKIVAELQGILARDPMRGLKSGDPGFRSASETLTAAIEAALSRYLPRLPSEMPTEAEYARVFSSWDDVVEMPALFAGWDPKVDPILVLHALLRIRKLPVRVLRDGVFLSVSHHYRTFIPGRAAA